jgi:hypothetical protein
MTAAEDDELTDEDELDLIAELFREQFGAALKNLSGDELKQKCRLLASNYIFQNQWLLTGLNGTKALDATEAVEYILRTYSWHVQST